MYIKDQLGSLRTGKLSRRTLTQSLLAAGVGVTAVPFAARKAAAVAEGQATFFTRGGCDILELFPHYQEKNGELPNFSIFGGSEEALTKMSGSFVVDVSRPCNSGLPRRVKSGLCQETDTSRLNNWAM